MPIHPLRKLRDNAGVPFMEAARRAKIDPGHLWRVEHGQSKLSVDSATRLAKVLKVDVGTVVTLLADDTELSA